MKHIVHGLKTSIIFSILLIMPTENIKAANLCNSGTEIFIGAYHSSIVSTKDEFFAFGEAIAANGVSNNLNPVGIIPANGYNYTGDLLFATDATHDTQAFILTTDGLYVWGASGANTAASHETAIVTGVAFHSIAMPVGVLPSNVTYLTATNGGVFLVAGGKVYAQGITPDIMGDNGAAADANSWHIVQKSSGGDLTNVEFFKANYNGAFAVTTSNEYYTWGTEVFLGNGAGSQTLTSATLMTAPFVGSASIIAVTGYDVVPGLSYYVLNPVDTKIYVLGGNSDGQLGIGSNGNTSTSWTTVKKSAGVDLVGVIDINADDNSDHYPTAGAIVNGYDDGSGPANDVFLVWGRNSSNALGAGSADIVYPYVPTGFITGTSRATKIEMGGHTTMYYDPSYIDTLSRKGKMCYIGHKINGSMGDGVSSSSTVSSFECDDTPWLPTLCAAEKPPVATDDDKINQPAGVVTLNVVTADNGYGIDSDPDGTVDASTVDLTPLTETIDQTLVVSGEGNWSVDATGLVTFTPDPALVGDPTDIDYTVQDNNGIESNSATIHITYIRQISINNVTQNELHSGTSTFNFIVSIDAASVKDINVTYTTNDGSATTTDSDYISTSGIATILAGDTNTTVSVTVNGDITVEPDETFTVDLSIPVGATIVDAQGVGTISNDDAVASMPSISLIKTVLAGANGALGDTITYNFEVNNTGNVDLTNISITDVNATVSGGPISLAAGAGDNNTFSATHIITAADIAAGFVTNQAIVTGTPPSGPDVNDTSDDNSTMEDDPTVTPVTAPVPSISLIKTVVAGANGALGDTITYNFEVNNTGNVDLTNISITDVNATISGGPISLAAGAGDNNTFSATHIITAADIAAGFVTNQAIVTGTPPSGPDVNDTSDDNSTMEDDPTVTPVTAPVPSISVEKTGTFMDEDMDGYANVGETVSYEFNVTNIGNVILYDVNLTDDNAIITGGPITSIVPGESDTVTFTAIHTLTWQDIIDGKVVNQAIVTAKDPQGNDVNDTSDDPQNPVNDDLNNDGEPDDETSTGLPIKPPTSTDDTSVGTTGEDVIIDIVNNDTGGTFTLDATTVTLTPSAGATDVVTVDGDVIGFTVPSEGTWSVDETTGEVTFSPENGYIGDPTPIEYIIEDTQGNETVSEITINYPPVANDDNTIADRDEVVTLDVLVNDQNTTYPLDPTTVRLIDPDGNEVETLYVLNEGTWIVESNGSVTFEPDIDFADNASITYIVRETSDDVSNEATITIHYPGVPLATDNGIILISEYSPTVIDVLANGDSWGSNGPGITEITFTQPTYGTVALDDGGTPGDPADDVLIYTPYPDYNDINDSFTYTITDALGFTSTANVTLYVECGSSQTSDGGDALGIVGMLIMMFLTGTAGLYFIRREERGEA